jgi:hypothetical protein
LKKKKSIRYFLFLGFDVPANYDDVGLNCGGLSIQKANGKSLNERFF